MRIRAWVTVFGVLAGVWVAGPSSTTAQTSIEWLVPSGLETVDPHATRQIDTLNILSSVYDSLLALDPEMTLVHRLAERVSVVTPDTYEFRLRPGVTFHDGAALTADDVIFSLNRARLEKAQLRRWFRDVAEVVKIDDLTLRIRLDQPSVNFLYRLTRLLVVDEDWVRTTGAGDANRFEELSEANGTGPFQVQGWQQNVDLDLVAFDGWWGASPSFRDIGVTLQAVPDPMSRAAALLGGDADMAIVSDVGSIEQLNAQGRMALNGRPNLTTYFVSLSVESEIPGRDGKNPLADDAIRRAVAMAIDRKVVGEALGGSFWQPATSIVSPSLLAGAGDGSPMLTFDPDAVPFELAQAGYPGGLPLEMLCPDNRFPGGTQVCDAIVGSLSKVGVKAELNLLDSRAYLASLYGHDRGVPGFPMSVRAWTSTFGDPLAPLANLGGSAGSGSHIGIANVSGFSSAELDNLILTAESEFDLAKRAELARQGYRLLNDAVVYIPLGVPQVALATGDWIEVPLRADGSVDLRYASLDGRAVGVARETAVSVDGASSVSGADGLDSVLAAAAPSTGHGGQSGGRAPASTGGQPGGGDGGGGQGGAPDPISATSLFVARHKFPPANYGAYGIVAFPALAGPASTERHEMICQAYATTLAPSSEQVAFGIPVEKQMVTVWPVTAQTTAAELNGTPHTPANVVDICERAVDAYDLPTADNAIRDAINADVSLGDGRGPFLIAWSPSTQKGRPDAIVLVLDMTNVAIPQDAEHAFSIWKSEIQTKPELWENGFRRGTVRYLLNRIGQLFPDMISELTSN